MIKQRRTAPSIALAALWLAFVGLWIRVFQQTHLKDVGAALGLLLGLGALYGLSVGVWVAHNISLARRRNRRRATETITIFPSHDYLGLPIEIRSNLMTEQEIEIKILNGVKQYLPLNKPGELANLEIAITDRTRRAGDESEDPMSKPLVPGPGARQ